jgi:hypothetical protein
VTAFAHALSIQRFDDHRYYHHSRVNQALHLLSAISFLASYVLLFIDPAYAAIVGWMVAMTSRQIGHFFFEPKGYDEINQATHEHKEAIKVGYNLHRKIVLLSIWAAAPIALGLSPSLGGLVEPAATAAEFVRNVGTVWLALGVGGLLFRGAQLWVLKDFQTAVVWITKILTDPFHDIKLYYRAPLQLLRGEWYEPMPRGAVEERTGAPSSHARSGA